MATTTSIANDQRKTVSIARSPADDRDLLDI